MNDAGISLQIILDFLKEEKIEFEYAGAPDVLIDGVSAVSDYREGTITWIRDEKAPTRNDVFYQLLVAPRGINLVNSNTLHCQDPRNLFFHILSHFFSQRHLAGIAGSAIISDRAMIGSDTSVGDFSVIGEDVVIGTGCKIESSVTIGNQVTIGDNCTIKSGARVGGDGFGYYVAPAGNLEKIPHLGSVRIGNRVAIGNNTCVDRGTLSDTVICDDVKIDNLCHVAHNCYIGNESTIVAGSILYGSCSIGKRVNIATAIIRDHCSVGDRCIVGMGAVVTKNIPNDTVVVGNPAKPLRSFGE